MQFDLAQLPEALGHEMGYGILDAGILNFEQYSGGFGAVDAVVIIGRSIVFVEESARGRWLGAPFPFSRADDRGAAVRQQACGPLWPSRGWCWLLRYEPAGAG